MEIVTFIFKMTKIKNSEMRAICRRVNKKFNIIHLNDYSRGKQLIFFLKISMFHKGKPRETVIAT